jgi:hypothetical protein
MVEVGEIQQVVVGVGRVKISFYAVVVVVQIPAFVRVVFGGLVVVKTP